MKLLVFGNEDHDVDNLAFAVCEKLIPPPGMEIVLVKPNDDLPVDDTKHVHILDTVLGIDKVTLITEIDLDKFVMSPRNSAHDYDLSFQLRYLTKIGKINKISVIGLPSGKEIDYDLIHSILRKFVAQDMQGS